MLNQLWRFNVFNLQCFLVIITLHSLVDVIRVDGWIIQHHRHRHFTSIRRPQQQWYSQQLLYLHPNLPDNTVQHGDNVYIVTGSNGYIGRAVVHELLNQYMSQSIYNHNIDRTKDEIQTYNTTSAMKILCLVRSHHVTNEQSYWINHLQQQQKQKQQQQQQQQQQPCSIHVFPYDMLDGGATFRIALQFALQNNASECYGTNSNNNYHDTMNSTTVVTSIRNLSSLCIFHIASVFGPTTNYEQTAYNNIRGTVDLINVLGTTITSSNIIVQNQCKFILTSSMAAVRGTGQVPLNQQYYTSKDWNTVSIINTTTTVANWGTYYQWSKMESERQAWDLCHNQWQNCISMVALCPSFVFGPPASMGSSFSSSPSSYSITLVDQWIRGLSPVQSRLFVDVRDVAKAHVMAAIQPAAIGKRIILSTDARILSKDIATWLQDEIRDTIVGPNIDFDPDKIYYDAEFQGGSIPIGNKEVDATEDILNILGITLRPVEDTIVDMAKILLTQNGAFNEKN
jgi:nucleoside-diphosphate-sugar epimerase